MTTPFERALCAVEFDEVVGRMGMATRLRSHQVRAKIGSVRMDLGGYDEIKNLYDVLGQLLDEVRCKQMELSDVFINHIDEGR